MYKLHPVFCGLHAQGSWQGTETTNFGRMRINGLTSKVAWTCKGVRVVFDLTCRFCLTSIKSYVESLETRLEAMEKLLTKVCSPFSILLDNVSFYQLLPQADLNQEIEALTTAIEPPSLPRNDDDPVEGELAARLFRLHVDPNQNRFFGKSRYLIHVVVWNTIIQKRCQWVPAGSNSIGY